MGVDHARKHGRICQIDDAGFARYLHRRADLGNVFATDKDNLLGHECSGLRIEQPGGSDGDNLVWRCYETAFLRVNGDRQEHQDDEFFHACISRQFR